MSEPPFFSRARLTREASVRLQLISMSKRPSKPAPLAIDAKLRKLETARAAVIAEILVLERKGAKDV